MQAKLKMIVLTFLHHAGTAQTEGVLKTALRAAFPGVAFTDADLTSAIRACETAGWISGTNDELLGNVWALTVNGKIRANQIA